LALYEVYTPGFGPFWLVNLPDMGQIEGYTVYLSDIRLIGWNFFNIVKELLLDMNMGRMVKIGY